MVNPTRITVAFDNPTADLLEKISTDVQVSQSEVMRRALKFYNENKALEDPATKKKIHVYLDMLLTGEHVILDVEPLAHVSYASSLPHQRKKNSGTNTKKSPVAHWEQLKTKVHSPKRCCLGLKSATFSN